MSQQSINLKTVLNVAEIAEKKGIMNPYQLHKRTGISVPRAQKIWKGEGKFDLTDIDLLCNTLPCQIKDLFKRIPDSPAQNNCL